MNNIFTERYTLGQIFRTAWQVLKQNIKPVLLITLLIHVPVFILELLMEGYLQNNAFFMQVQTDPFDYDAFAQILLAHQEDYRQIVLYAGVTLLIQYLFISLSFMALALVAYHTVKGEKVLYQQAVVGSFSKIIPLLAASVIHFFIMITTAGLIVVPFIFMVFFCFYAFAIVLRQKRGVSSLVYSFKLVSGQFLRTTAWIVVLLLFYTTLTTLIRLVLLLLFIPHVLIYLIVAFIHSFFGIVFALWFVNLDAIKFGAIN